MTFNIEGKEIVVDDKLVAEYETAMGYPLTDLKMRSIYETVIDDCDNLENLQKGIEEIIHEYIEVANDMPMIVQKIENGDIES